MVAHHDDESFGLGAVIDMLAAGGTAALILCYTRVSRKRQRHAALLHSSQISPAAVLWRRLQLQGEWRAPALARPARGGRHVPAVRRGEARAGREAGDVAMVCPVMTAVSDDDEVREKQRASIRARLAFYWSTPGYRVVFDESGWPGVGEQLNRLQREGKLDEMKRTITDEMVDAFAITSTWDELPARLLDRFGNLADDIVCYSVIEQWDDNPDSLSRWQDVNRRLRNSGGNPRLPR